MAHEEYIRIVPGSTRAVLVIHGILGTPDHFRDLLPLIPEDYSVYNILLDGHGGKVENFSHTSMSKWKAQVTARLDELTARHDRILIVAHSMGTLLAIREAVRRPEKLAHLFLLQIPLRPRLKLRTACYAVLLPFGIVPEKARDMQEDCGVILDPRLWKYLGWIPRFLELFAECRCTRGLLGQLTVPCSAYQSRHDQLVSLRTLRDLRKHPHIRTTLLPNSGHFQYTGEDLQLLQTEFAQLFL